MYMDENTKENVINVTIDTVEGPIEERIDLDSLPLDEVADLVALLPELKKYYGMRLVKELKD
jgi:hypothetical protein